MIKLQPAANKVDDPRPTTSDSRRGNTRITGNVESMLMETSAGAGTPAATWLANWATLRKTHRDAIPDVLGPPEVFADRTACAAEREEYGHQVAEGETGANCRTVQRRLTLSCAGWRRVPNATEFYDAVHHPEGTVRETAILMTWYQEAELGELLDARLEEAYSWRELVTALHRIGLTNGEGARRLNHVARR